MAYKTFTNGSVLTDSDLNTYLMKQSVIVCTSGTRPASPVEGMTIFETDTNQLRIYESATWNLIATTGYPQAWQNLTLVSGYTGTSGSFSPQARFVRPGRVELRGSVTKTSGSFASSTPFASLPSSGWWPGLMSSWICPASLQSNSGYMMRVDVYANGNLVPFFSGLSTAYAPGWVELNGIEYDIA